MAIVSKPYKVAINWLGSYLSQLYTNPIRTKAITAAVIASLGNYTAQSISGIKPINFQTLSAFGLYGLLFGGTIPHYFYEILQRIISDEARTAPIQMLIIERLLFMPIYQFFSLYMLSRLEMKSHGQAISHALRFYLPILEANFKYLSLLQFLNLYFVPPMLRVLVNNMIGFCWVIYLAQKRNPPARKGKKN